jgi:MFS family permease
VKDAAFVMPGDQQKNAGARFGFLRGNMLVMTATSGIWQFTGNAVWPFLSLYVLALGGPPEMIGVISGLGTLSSMLPTVFGGYLADVYGRKKVTALFSVIMGFTSLLIALASDWRMLAVAVAVDAIAAGFREPAMSALIADSLSYESRGVGFAAWAIIPAIPSVVSPVIAGYLIDAHGALLTVKWGYALTGLTALIAGICRHLFLKETVRVRRSDARSVSSMARAVTTTHRELSRELWILLVAENLFWLGWAAASPYFVLYGTTDIIGLTAGEWGLILLISNMAKVLGFVFGSAADRYGRRNVTVVSSLLVGISSFLFLQLKTFPQVAVIFAINVLSTLVAQQMIQALRADACQRESRSRVYSFFIIGQYFTRTVGSVMGGFLYIYATKAMPFYFQTIVSVMSAAILASLLTERVRRR